MKDPQRPKAYLNYILFDENMEIVSTFTGSFQANGNGAWQEIGTTAPMEIPANGYLAVYLSNQSRPTGCHVCGDVFFDKVKVRFSQGKLKEETHYFGFAQYKYYPFGLPMGNAGSTASNFLPNRRKYQSNEYIKDLSLNWMDFNFRSYDPQLGRFLSACTERSRSVDPLAAIGGQDRLSPYAAMGNQPEFAVDPEGLIPGLAFQTAGGAGMGGFEGGFAEGSLALRAPWQDENSLFFSVGGGGSWTENAYAKFIVDYANWVAKLELKRQNGDAAKKDSPARNYEEESNAQQAWVDFFNGGGNIGLNEQSAMAWLDPPPEKEEIYDWYGHGSRSNWKLNVISLGFEHSPGSFRLGTKKLGFSPKYYGNGWTGNMYAKTFNIGKVGRGLGYFSVGLGIAMDIRGMWIYKDNPNSPNAVHPGKAGLNTGMAAFGIFISGPGAALYFGMDAFHPGGWPGFFENYGDMSLRLQNVYGPSFRLVPFGPK